MKFGNFKEFRRDSDLLEDVVQYLKVDVPTLLRDLSIGLKRLTLGENFLSFQSTVTDLAAGETITINNLLNDNGRKIIPSGYLIVKKRSGRDSSGALLANTVPVQIVDGDEEWTLEKLYLKNVGSQIATFTVIFLK